MPAALAPLFLTFATAIHLSTAIQLRASIAPPLTSPDENTVWIIGNKYNVTWDTSDLPPLPSISSPLAKLYLGQFDGDDLDVNFDNPLAQNFLITSGVVEVTCPDVPTDSPYFVNLFGSSGDISPSFKIERGSLSSAAALSAGAPTSTAGSSSPSAPESASTAQPTGALKNSALSWIHPKLSLAVGLALVLLMATN